ncbi:50S ribosomal protein L25 [Candidatus Parcubacteria bacterium]|nr:50S ribosomal protein L25 [Candidatus Parcubacteria bacterium]
MLSLSAEIRDEKEKTDTLRQEGFLPAVLYGPKIKNFSLQVNEKEFEKVFKEAGESSLIKLKVGENEFLVLIHDFQKDPLKGSFIHIDFYQPVLDEETEATVSLEFLGEAPAVKELGGTLVKNIKEIEVKALPQNLPHSIKVNVESLKTFEDSIMVKDLQVPEGVKVLKEQEEVIVLVTPPEKVEEELEKPVEEKVEEVEKVGEKEKEEKEAEKEEPASAEASAGKEEK